MTHELELGIFARVFPPDDARSLAETIRSHDLSQVQLNLVALRLPTIPDADELREIDFGQIGSAFRSAGVSVWGVSVTYNMAHPDDTRRRSETQNAAALAPHLPDLGALHMTLCTGSRDPKDKWRAHPDNITPGAWADMLESFSVLADAASAIGVTLVVEPEPGNVVKDTDTALRLIDDLGERGEAVRFILDPANLATGKAASERKVILEDAFTRLGDRTVCIHAKDVVAWGDRIGGAEGLDFAHVMSLRNALPTPVPVIIQDTMPEQVDPVVQLLRAAQEAASR